MLNISTISVTGADAFEFLQGQLTNDLRRLDSESEILAAWCSPKGRVLWFGAVRTLDDGYGLTALAEIADDIVRRLSIFRFRSNVEFETVDDGETVDPAFLIEHGYPWIGTSQMEQFTPHMLNLDLLDAISLDKGCYTGQEIVARTHYKGATKRRTLRYTASRPVTEGEKISLNGRNVGQVLNVFRHDLLAIVPIADVPRNLAVGATTLRHTPLPYLEKILG